MRIRGVRGLQFLLLTSGFFLLSSGFGLLSSGLLLSPGRTLLSPDFPRLLSPYLLSLEFRLGSPVRLSPDSVPWFLFDPQGLHTVPERTIGDL